MDEVPADRCGYTWPENHEEGDSPNRQSCCWRQRTERSSRCIWHADGEEVSKSIEELQEVRAPLEIREQSSPVAEILDGAELAGLDIDSKLPLDSVSLRQSTFSEASLRSSDLAEADLSGADLTGAQLITANLSDANLREADFRDAYLINADLPGADIGHADLTDADLSNADLTDADLVEATFIRSDISDADLPGASLRGADLSGADLFGADLTATHLGGTTLSDAYMVEADLSGAFLWGAELVDTDLQEATLSNAELKQATLTGCRLRMADLSDADLWEADLSGANLRDTDLTSANLHKTDVSAATLTDADLSGSYLASADLSDAVLKRTEFATVDLRETLLSESDLFGDISSEVDARLREAPVGDSFGFRGGAPAALVEANLKRVNLEDADCGFTNLREAVLTSADCENTRFDRANLNRATLENADLTSANFSQAYLYQTRLNGGQISYQTQFHPGGPVGDLTTPNACRYDSTMPPSTPAASIEPGAVTDTSSNAEVLRARRARSTYNRLEDLATQNGFPNMKSDMYINRQEARRELLFAQDERSKGVFAQLQKWLLMYGESFRRVLSVSAVTVTVFWVLFTVSGTVETVDGTTVNVNTVASDPRLGWETLYYSLSLFFAGSGSLSTTGSIGQVLVVSLRAIGPILLALLVFVLGRRAAR